MSHQAAEVQEERMADATLENVRELTPEAAEAKAVLDRVGKVLEATQLPSFEEALAEVEAVQSGDNKKADLMSHKYGGKNYRYIKRVPGAPDGGPGWHAELRENGALTPEQSSQLAELINSKIDVTEMKAAAERKRAKLKEKEVSQNETETETAPESVDPEEVMARMMIGIDELGKSGDLSGDLKELEKIAILANDAGFVRKTKNGVVPVKDVKGSHELAEVINAKKKELSAEKQSKEDEIREKQRTERRIDGFKRVINEMTDAAKLEGYCWRILDQETHFLKKVNLKNQAWTVQAIEGKYGSQTLVDIVLTRKDAIKQLKKAEVEARRKKAIATLGDKYKIVKR